MTTVPRPAPLTTLNPAPTASARSRMFRRPKWPAAAGPTSKPRPSSPISSRDAVVALPEIDPRLGRLGVTSHVVERLLGDAVHRGLHVGSQLPATPLGGQPHVGADAAAARLDEMPQQFREGRLLEGVTAHLEQHGAHARQGAARQPAQLLDGAQGLLPVVRAGRREPHAFRLAANSDCVTESCRSRARRVRSASTAVSSMRALSRAFSIARAAWSANARAIRTRFSSSDRLSS